MRIVIDMQGAQTESRFRGIGRYTCSLVEAMLRKPAGHEFILALNGLLEESVEQIRARFDGLLPQERIVVWHPAGPLTYPDNRSSPLKQCAEEVRDAFFTSLNADFIVVTALFEGCYGGNAAQTSRLHPWSAPAAVIQYDLIPLLNAEEYFSGNPLYEERYREKIEHLKNAELLLCISESARQEAINHLKIAKKRAVTIGAAVDAHFRPVGFSAQEAAGILSKLNISRPFVLYTGATDERKNHLRLISAYAALPKDIRRQHQLVIAGIITDHNFNKFQAAVRSAGLDHDEVVITGGVTDDELRALYNLTKLYVFPSWHEGFGLPLLEAMQSGAAVIASNATSMPEIVGRPDALFDPFEVTSITHKLQQGLTDEAWLQDLAAHGLKRAESYSWDESARKTIKALEAAHAGQSRVNRPAAPASVSDVVIESFAQSGALGLGDEVVLSLADGLARSFPPIGRQPQLLLDVSELVTKDARTGVQRVVRSLLSRFLAHPPAGFTVRLVYSAQEGGGYRYAQGFTDRFLNRTERQGEDEPIEVFNGDLFFGLDLQHHVVIHNAENYQRWRQSGARVVFLMHDLLPVLMPEAFDPAMSEIHHRWLGILAGSDGVVAVSRAVMDEYVEWLDVHGPMRYRPLKLGWSHSGANLDGSVPSRAVNPLHAQQLAAIDSGTTFLMVGTLEPRKGHLQALDAFEALWAEGQDVNLIIVGKTGWQVAALLKRLRDHPRSAKKLLWFEGISDEFLEQIYDRANALIAASMGEGFGLPLIEAAKHGLPIIARDLPVFREIAGDYATYFSGQGSIDLASAVKEWLSLRNEGNVPSSDHIHWNDWDASYVSLTQVLLNNGWQGEWLGKQMK